MAKDYVLFVHGVNTREDDPAHPQYAKALIDDITPRLQTFLDATAEWQASPLVEFRSSWRCLGLPP